MGRIPTERKPEARFWYSMSDLVNLYAPMGVNIDDGGSILPKCLSLVGNVSSRDRMVIYFLLYNMRHDKLFFLPWIEGAKKKREMGFVAITISVHYSDKLPYIIHNRKHIDAWYFVVDRRDTKTISFLNGVRDPQIYLVYFDGFTTPQLKFNKSGALNFAQSLVHASHPDDWVLILDSDIVLSPNFSNVVSAMDLDKECLYGCPRFDYRSKVDLVMGHGVPYATMKKHHFVGYFQMYFRKDALYPLASENCGECDVVFLETYFPKKVRQLLPLKVKHLGYSQVNWDGRREPLW